MYLLCGMEYSKQDLKPIVIALKSAPHGTKKDLAEHLGIKPQQLSFYLKYRNMNETMFRAITMFCDNLEVSRK